MSRLYDSPFQIGDHADRVYVNPCDTTAGLTITRICPDGTVVRLTQAGNKFTDAPDGRRAVSRLDRPLQWMTTEERLAASMPDPL